MNETEVDDVYFDRPYYLAPADRSATGAFGLIREGLASSRVVAIAEAVLFRRVRTRAHPCLRHGTGGDYPERRLRGPRRRATLSPTCPTSRSRARCSSSPSTLLRPSRARLIPAPSTTATKPRSQSWFEPSSRDVGSSRRNARRRRVRPTSWRHCAKAPGCRQGGDRTPAPARRDGPAPRKKAS